VFGVRWRLFPFWYIEQGIVPIFAHFYCFGPHFASPLTLTLALTTSGLLAAIEKEEASRRRQADRFVQMIG
jgi:hypothetical protein